MTDQTLKDIDRAFKALEQLTTIAKINNIAQILDECIMNCEYHEHMEEGD